MKLRIEKLTKYAGALAVAILMPLAHADLVTDGGFEASNSSTIWNPTGAASIVSPTSLPTDPSHSLNFQDFSTFNSDGTPAGHVYDGSASQAFNDTTLGELWHIEFWTLGDITGLKASIFSDPQAQTITTFDLLDPSFSAQQDANTGWTKHFGDIQLNGDYLISFSIDTTGSRKGFDFNIDNVSVVDCSDLGTPNAPSCVVSSTVPEPSTLLLVGFALVAIATVRRKSRA